MKKGFTLIELLAVILILGIIALIAIPTITNIIEESKKGAFKSSIQNIMREVEENCRIEQMKELEHTGSYTFNESGSTPKINVKGTLPISGTITIDNECNITITNLSDGKYVASKNADSEEIVINDETDNDNTFIATIKRNNTIGTPITIPITGFSSLSEKSFLKGTDSDGDTFYYRGNVDNNYVEFGTYKQEIYSYDDENEGILGKRYYATLSECEESQATSSIATTSCTKLRSIGDPMIWRIIRINGDGTVRMILHDSIGRNIFSGNFDDPKYVGYTYDRVDSSIGTGSEIKTYLDNWYALNIGNYANLDDLVATTKFCNDTSAGNSIYDKYGFTRNRVDYDLNTASPTFECPITSETYGGQYNLKVGLITADELVYAGVFRGVTADTNQYLWNGDEYWTMTPSGYDGAFSYIISAQRSFSDAFNVDPFTARPVINIKGDAIVSGSGKIDDQYKIVSN